MTKEPKILPLAIKAVVGKYGKEVVRDVRLVNIMSDMVSLDESVAIKNILREVLKDGYGGKILTIDPSKDDCHLKVRSYSKTIAENLGFKEVIVQYTLYSIAYGIGLITGVPHLKDIASPGRETEVVKTKVPKETTEAKKVPYLKYAAILIFLLVVFIYGLSFWNSSEEREKYEDRVSVASSFLNSGDYANAVESYKEAYNGYNAMNSDSYKKEALEKIDDLADKLIKDGETDNKSLIQAKKVIQSELQLNLGETDRERVKNKLLELENIIQQRVENGRNALVTNVSANGGKLDENGRQLLEQQLELAPDDYWLNFIKKKSYE